MNRSAVLSLVVLFGSVFSTCALAEEFVLNFGAEEIIKADGNDIVVPGYSVPSFVDWNNDGLQDLVVGEGGGLVGVPPAAKVRVYLNRGTEAQPLFKDFFYVQADGKDLTLTPEFCMGCFPRVVDWDEDGRIDLLVGVSDGTVRIYMNVTDNNGPAFDAGTNLKVGPDAIDLDVGKRPTPIVVDWNNDGMLDVVCGAWDGYIHVFYNCGCGGSVPPRFTTTLTPLGMIVQESGHDLLVPSTRSSPVVMDFDGDGKKDLLTGCTDGMILLYRNIGTESLPIFSGYSLVQSNGQPIDLPSNQRARPFICHWTGAKDGYWDLLVGYGDGKIRLYRGIPKVGDFDGDGVLGAGDFTVLAEALDQPVPAAVSPADLNKDGAVDVVDLRMFADLWLSEHGTVKK